MSEQPLSIVSSAAQAPVQAREVAAERDVRRADQAGAARRQTRAIDEAGVTVDTDDADARVFTEAEGGGSQGRSFEEEKLQAEPSLNEAPPEGAVPGPDGQWHLDIEA